MRLRVASARTLRSVKIAGGVSIHPYIRMECYMANARLSTEKDENGFPYLPFRLLTLGCCDGPRGKTR